MSRQPYRLLQLLAFGALAAGLLLTGMRGAQAQGALAEAAHFSLRWSVQRNVSPPQGGRARSLARFTLANRGPQALPAQGWALYFNCIAGVETGPAEGPFLLEQVTGTLYRLKPAADFTGVAPGQALDMDFLHPEPMLRPDKAPQGPYLVFDDTPDRGVAITDYRIEAPTHAEPLAQAEGEPPAPVSARVSPRVSPQETFQRNADTRTLDAATLPPVFPTPVAWAWGEGRLHWRSLPRIHAPPSLQHEAAHAKAWLAPFFDADAASPGTPGLHLAVRRPAAGTSPDAYTLRVDPRRGVTLTGASAAGVARGLQSLRDLLPLQPQPAQGVVLRALQLRDAPRFEHRGVLLDVARNFHPKATVFRLLDLMARFKLNTLHLHLTDDEGWRLAVPGLPELTDFGARRGHSADPARHLPPAYGSGPDVANSDGSGHYSAADYTEILRYAAARRIDVIPEIEMPGHARAAVHAMAARAQRLAAAGDPAAEHYRLADPADRSVYRTAQLYTDNLMDPGLPSTYRFIAHVVAELARLHRAAGVPLRTLHVGADELPAGAWSRSPAAQAAITRLGLQDSAGLWNHFYDRVEAILRQHGIVPSGWEELGARRARPDGSGPLVPNEHFLGRGHTLYVWNNLDDADDLAYRLANAGYRTVLAPATTLYFDMAHNRDPDEPGVDWAAYTDLDKVFDLVPFDLLRKSPTAPTAAAGKAALTASGKAALTAAGRRRIAGLEATLFSETLRGPERLEFMLLPRLFGLAERAWAPDPAWARETDAARAAALHGQAWSVFANQVGRQVLPRLQRDLPGLRWRIAPPGLQREGAQVQVNHQLPGLVLRYTTDGSAPTTASAAVDGPLPAGGVLRVAAFAPDGRRGAIATLDTR